MSSRLLGCIQFQLDKLFPDFITIWLDRDHMVHVVFSIKLFLSDDAVSVIKDCIREILFQNKKLNPNYWCTCLPYELRKEVIIKIHYV